LPGTVLEIVVFSHWGQNGPAALAVDAWFEGPVTPDPDLAAGPGEDIVLLALASPLGPFKGKVLARVSETVEQPPYTKEVVAAPGAGLLGFEVRRGRPEAACTVYPSADLAADGTGADPDLDLPAGAVRSVALRLPSLDAGEVYLGRIEVRDEQDRVRLAVPLL